LFFIKGLICIVIAFKIFDDVYPHIIGANLWDFLNMLFTEIGPTVVLIVASTIKSKKSTLNEDEDIEHEKELHSFENR